MDQFLIVASREWKWFYFFDFLNCKIAICSFILLDGKIATYSSNSNEYWLDVWWTEQYVGNPNKLTSVFFLLKLWMWVELAALSECGKGQQVKKVMHVSVGECCFVSILVVLCRFGFFLLLFFSESFVGCSPNNDQIDALIVLFCFPRPCFDTWGPNPEFFKSVLLNWDAFFLWCC